MGHAHVAGRCKAELYVSLTCALRIVQVGVESDLRQVPLHGALGVTGGRTLAHSPSRGPQPKSSLNHRYTELLSSHRVWFIQSSKHPRVCTLVPNDQCIEDGYGSVQKETV